MKKSFFMLIILFICGFVSADVCIEVIKESGTLVSIDVYEGYANAKLAFKDVFWNILYERLKLFFFLILLSFTPIREKASMIILSVFSFVWGFFIMSAIAELGIAGVVVGIASVLPHGLLYGGLLMLMFRRKRVHSYHTKDKIMLNVAYYIFMLLLFVTGCVVESLVSTHFIPWVIRLSLI